MDWTQPFLDALRSLGKVSPAARAVGVATRAIAERRKADADFAAAVEEAIDECHDGLEVEMVRRARDGAQEPIIYKGQLQYLTEPVLDDDGNVVRDATGEVVQRPVRDANGDFVPLTVAKKSDAMLALALKGYRKRTFAERTELTGADGEPLNPEVSDADRAARIAALLDIARQRKDAEDLG